MNKTTNFNGIIEIGTIQNVGERSEEIGLLTAKSVHYPDCQQLILWLPEYGGAEYGSYCVTNKQSQTIQVQGLVAEKLNGSVQLVFDTLPWPSSDYVLEIEHPKNGKHVLHFQKLPEGVLPAVPTPLEPNTSVGDSMWRVYTDGFGNPIPNEDWNIREKSNEEIMNVFGRSTNDSSPRLEYEDQGRAGNVIYLDGSTQIKFWYEMGGGDCKLFIDVPPTENWEKQTNTPLSRRDEILSFIARTTQREQASTWRYEIHEREIAFYG